jgi:hypothetical protein
MTLPDAGRNRQNARDLVTAVALRASAVENSGNGGRKGAVDMVRAE